MRERRGRGQGAGRFRERQGEPATVIFKGRGWRVWRARFFPKEVKEKVGDRPVSQGGEREKRKGIKRETREIAAGMRFARFESWTKGRVFEASS